MTVSGRCSGSADLWRRRASAEAGLTAGSYAADERVEVLVRAPYVGREALEILEGSLRELEFCRREADDAFPREAGGVLMGWHRQERAEIVIVHAIGPGPSSIRRSNRFDPDNEHHIAEVGHVTESTFV